MNGSLLSVLLCEWFVAGYLLDNCTYYSSWTALVIELRASSQNNAAEIRLRVSTCWTPNLFSFLARSNASSIYKPLRSYLLALFINLDYKQILVLAASKFLCFWRRVCWPYIFAFLRLNAWRRQERPGFWWNWLRSNVVTLKLIGRSWWCCPDVY